MPSFVQEEEKSFCEIQEAVKLLEKCKLDEELSKHFVPKRQELIGFEDKFMGFALLESQQSKDPVTQVGCVIVTKEKIVKSFGHNKMPRGYDDDEDIFPWGKNPDRSFLNKISYVCHAEESAIINAKADLKGMTLYSTLFPCNRCAKMIVEAGISEVVYMNYRPDNDEVLAAKAILAKIDTRKFVPQRKQIVLNFE